MTSTVHDVQSIAAEYTKMCANIYTIERTYNIWDIENALKKNSTIIYASTINA